MRQGPLTGRYPAVAAMVVFALVPYLCLSAALQPLSPIIARELHMSMQAMSLALGMANAAYAIGTVFAVQFALRLPQRRMLLAYGVLLVAGSVLAASATAPGVFIAGHVLQGLCTSLLLIAALPPLIIGYPVSKARWTAIILNLCIFGAVALGPFIGGVQASAHAWRPLFWVIAGIALTALVLSLLTFEDVPPADRRRPLDPLALGLATGGCVAAFFGAVGSGLIGVGVGSAVTPALFLVGFSLRSTNLQRVFAIVELLRAVAAFMIAPVMLHFALTVGGSLSAGTTTALWICFGLSAGGALVGIGLYALGRVRPPTPAFDSWLAGKGPAWDSPPLLAAIREATPAVGAPERLTLVPTAHAGAAPVDGRPSGVPPAPVDGTAKMPGEAEERRAG